MPILAPPSESFDSLSGGQLATPPLAPRPLSQAAGLALPGYVGLFWLPVEDLLADPLADGSDISADLQLRVGAAWLELRVTQSTIKFDETPKQAKGVTTYTTKVSALRPLASDEMDVLDTMENRRCVVMLREASGRMRLVGGRESFLLFRAGSEGSNASSRAGLDLLFGGELDRRARYYRGAFPVAKAAGVVDEAAPVGTTTGTGTVEVRNRAGKLIARVEAGKVITISSGFRVALKIS